MKKIVQWAVIVVVVGFIGALFLYNVNMPKTEQAYEPWHEAMVMGSLDAPNRMVEYTDYFCSFCADLHFAMTDEFKKEYIDTGKLSFETRIVDILSGVSVNTPKGNRAAFCAADQNKYWEYSHEIITAIHADFFSKGIGVKNVANPVKIQPLDDSYFVTPAKTVGLDTDTFSTCLASDTHDKAIHNNSQRAVNSGVTGLPHISVNDYTAAGFGGGGFAELKLILKAGGVN